MGPTAISQLIEAFCKVGIGVTLAIWARSKGYADHVVASYTILGVTIGVFLGMIFLYVRKMFFKDEEYFLDIDLDNQKRKTAELFKEMIRIAIPITLSSSVLSLTTVLDTVMVQNRLLDYGMNEISVRIYYGDYTSLVISMFTLPTIFLYPIANALVPVIATAHESGNKKREEMLRALGVRVVIIIAMPCAIGLSVFSKPILNLLMFKADSVERAGSWLSVAAVSVLFLGLISITNSFLNSVGKQKLPIISMIVGALVKLVSNYFLLGEIGIMGAPISTVLCYLAASTLNIAFVIKYVGSLPSINDAVLKPFGCATFAVLCSAITYYFIIAFINIRIATIASIFLASILYLLLIFKFKAITQEELALMPKSNLLIKLLRKIKFLPKIG